MDNLTSWKKEPTIEDLKKDLDNSQSHHSLQEAKIDDWLDALEVRGSHKPQVKKNKSSIQPQLVKKQAEWRYAALSEPFLSHRKLFEVSPVSWEDRKASEQNSLILNNQFDTKINKVKFIDNLIRAAVNEGTAIVRVAWLFQEKEVEVTKPVFSYQEMPMNEEVMGMLQELSQLKQMHPDSYEQTEPAMKETLRKYEEEQVLVMVEQTGEETVMETKTVKNQPDLSICNYKDIIVDPTCEGDLDDAKFIIHKFESSYADLKATGMYKNLDKLLDKDKDKENYLSLDDSKVSSESTETNFTFDDNSRRKFTVYEYWGYWDKDGKGDLTCFVACWVGDTLIRMEESPFPDNKLPFVFIPYLPVKNSLYGEPDGALIADHQKIIGAVTRGIIDLLALSANGQMAYPKGALDAVNKKRFFNGDDYEYNPTNGIDPRNSIFLHQFPEIPRSALEVLQMFEGNAETLTGIKSFGSNLGGNSLGDTATGVRGALDASSKREMGILRRLSNGIVQIGRKIISMNFEFLEEEEVVRITNEEFISVRKDDLVGDFDLRLSIATAEVDNAKAQELSFMMQTMGNTLPPEQSNIILSEIARLRNMPDLAKEIREYQPQPDPMQEQMQQLQMQKLEAEIGLIQAQAAEAGAKSQVQQTKVGVEQARAASLQGDADNKANKFMSDTDGTEHRRNMEKEQLKQAAALENTKIAKAADLEKEIAKNMSKQLLSLGGN